MMALLIVSHYVIVDYKTYKINSFSSPSCINHRDLFLCHITNLKKKYPEGGNFFFKFVYVIKTSPYVINM